MEKNASKKRLNKKSSAININMHPPNRNSLEKGPSLSSQSSSSQSVFEKTTSMKKYSRSGYKSGSGV